MPEIGASLIAAAIAGYAATLVGWRVLLHRWGLAGARAPPRTALGRQELLARRWLKALLALDAVLIIPLAVVAVALAVLRAPDATFLILIALFFLMPVPGMLRKVRILEAYRVRGLPEPGPEQRTTGHEPLDRLLRRPARATQVTAGVIVAFSVAAWLWPPLSELLEKRNDEILSGQVWRLATVALVHANLIHLFFNVSVFLDVAGIVERLAGAVRMLAVFWMGTVAATLASVAALPEPAVGASGGVFAVLGALLAIAVRHRRELPPAVRARLMRSTGFVIGANVLLGFVLPRIDWAAHLGGVAAGAVLGWVLGMGGHARAALSERPLR